MMDSTGYDHDKPMDRYVRRELTAEEARQLAQSSLDDPELFEDLTASALAVAAVAAPSAKVVRFPRKTRLVVAGMAAAAAVVLVALYSMRPSLVQQHQIQQTIARSPVQPALASSASPGQPILLASGLQLAPAGRENAPVFRSPEPVSRSPRPAGSITSIKDGLATINLGSLDGLGKGNQVQIVRDGRPVGSLTLTTVFRDSARGRIPEGPRLQVNDQVRVPPATHLKALLEQADAMSGRGDLDAARRMAETAASWAETANVPPAELERLARLEYQLGSPQVAEKHYQSALDNLTSGDHSAALNDLAVLRMLRGDYDGAEATLRRALSTSPKDPRSLNNLGVLTELRGDRQNAQALYMIALRAAANFPEPERQALETNLARVRGAR
jgi:TolA-binding protein